jgi:hypothetical protein
MSLQSVELSAPISSVQSFLQKSLKPHRKQISAVTFTNGRIEQVTEATLQLIDAPALEAKKEEPKPKAAVTVAQPTLGCPPPDFDDVEVRANRVLRLLRPFRAVMKRRLNRRFCLRVAQPGA